MRKVGVRLAGALGVALLLSGCGSAGFSYSQGYSVGQSVAANGLGGSMDAHDAAVACHHEWSVSAPAGATKRDWLHGCLVGYTRVARTVRP